MFLIWDAQTVWNIASQAMPLRIVWGLISSHSRKFTGGGRFVVYHDKMHRSPLGDLLELKHSLSVYTAVQYTAVSQVSDKVSKIL